MYFEEKVILGILCWRAIPDGQWKIYDKKQLTKKILELKTEVADLKFKLELKS